MCAEIILEGLTKGDKLGPEEPGQCGQWSKCEER